MAAADLYLVLKPPKRDKNSDQKKKNVAPPGHLLRLDFRNDFHLEQSEDCRFDYLEIRDGAHGYSNLIGSYCGNKHPPPITSSDRYLWLRFASDENIQYSGFHAVYWYIPRPTNSDQHPEMDMCRIEVSGNEGFANRSDINENRIRFSSTYGLPLDCMWIISVEQGWKIMLQFLKFRLEKPNDCESNFVDVFSDRTDLPSRLKNFCGSIADSVISKSNILHLRFFAEARSINSTFEALYTAFRDKPRDEACEEDEYDCEDATCISIDLRCNGRINCRFRWDEDECQPKLGAFAVILESEHIIIILVVFCLILSGMCFAFLFNCTKKLIRDHRIIQEHMRQSKGSGASITGSKSKLSTTDSILPKLTALANQMGNNSEDSSLGTINREDTKLSPLNRTVEEVHGNVSSGDSIPSFGGRKGVSTTKVKPGDTTEEDFENLELSSLPEMRDSECQTRESLFSNHSIESTPIRSFIPTPNDQKIHPKATTPNSFATSNRSTPFSTFGYTRVNDENAFGFPCFGDAAPRGGNEKRYKAEAVIEVESQNHEADLKSSNPVRPFSIDSTKSAPDVIVTH
ncbi:hypothetical protein RUM44_002365 [Polyplax serrata]|uniref:CUB domain-containing protein n=1 Tax=Polyplax serrata TaxID=468196 RepID=A0ABR1AMN1_POLSC